MYAEMLQISQSMARRKEKMKKSTYLCKFLFNCINECLCFKLRFVDDHH